MKYKIYQVYYEETQKKFLNSEFTPFDNTFNKKPNLFEYYLFFIGYKQAISENLSHWGFFSWKWKSKCKIKPQQFIEFIESNPNQDVYVMNWAPYKESIYDNIWNHGEYCHPGLIYIFNKLLKKIGFDSYTIGNIIMDRKTFCFSSYFVASKKFWRDYLTFLKKIKFIIDNDIELKRLIYGKTTYNNHQSYSFFPFLIERLFSTFLVMYYEDYCILNYPYDFSIYKKYIGDDYKELEKCSEIKSKICKSLYQNDMIMVNKYQKDLKNQMKKIILPIQIPDYD